MRITKMARQQRRPERFSIYVDGQYSFSLPESELLRQCLYEGFECDETALMALKRRSAEAKVYERMLVKLARRAHTEQEIHDYLQQRGYETELITAVIARLRQRGCFDDAAFAETWVASRRRLKHRSNRALRSELRAKGVSSDIITEVLAQTTDAERTTLRQLYARKRGLSAYQDPKKLRAYLLRRGYPYDAVRDVMASSEE